MKVIGLTGPSGAGKTIVAQMLDLPVINADSIARQVHKDPEVLARLCERFGEDIARGGMLNRTLLASRAFADPQSTADLNAITHPKIIERIHQALASLTLDGTPCCVLDAPLLFEAGANTMCAVTVAVLADRDMRKNRIVERDGITAERAQQRIDAQPDDAFYLERCDHVIRNNGRISDLHAAVQALRPTLIQPE